jgi:kinesin family protein 15
VVAGKPITETCLSGYNGTIFAYGNIPSFFSIYPSGQTGSGKTFTILGSENPIQSNTETVDSSRGLIPRILEYLFCLISREERNVRSPKVPS